MTKQSKQEKTFKGKTWDEIMNDKQETSEHKVVKDFTYKGRRCVVIRVYRDCFILKQDYHNGYVELKENEIKESYHDYDINSDEITYQGKLDFKTIVPTITDGKTYIGFDSAHFWNEEKPESKTAEYVEGTCRKIVDELTKQESSEDFENLKLEAGDYIGVTGDKDFLLKVIKASKPKINNNPQAQAGRKDKFPTAKECTEISKEFSKIEERGFEEVKKMVKQNSPNPEKEIKMKTNTAYLLNTWLPEDTLWKDVRKFISKIHKEHWEQDNPNTSGFIEITFKVSK